jgi:hypothetical protein
MISSTVARPTIASTGAHARSPYLAFLQGLLGDAHRRHYGLTCGVFDLS